MKSGNKLLTNSSVPVDFELFQIDEVLTGRAALVESIKILLYKFDPNIFELLEFENDRIYREPLLFSFFIENKESRSELMCILFGYISQDLRPKTFEIITDYFGRKYLPNFGWICTEAPNTALLAQYLDGRISLFCNGKEINYVLEPLEYIDSSNIELLKYPIPLLDQFYFDANNNLINNVEIETITRKMKGTASRAWSLIKTHVPRHFELIESVITSCVIFNIDPLLRNSFAAQGAHGIGFFNSYQDEYNEVFFVDDIAHQTGHVIYMALIHNVREFLKVDPEFSLQKVTRLNSPVEDRNILVVFHAYYTYYKTFLCLDSCLTANAFQKSKRHEALGRIAFYIIKSKHDLDLIPDPDSVFTDKGLRLFKEFERMHNYVFNKWGALVGNFNLMNQPYNFTYSKFLESNAYNED